MVISFATKPTASSVRAEAGEAIAEADEATDGSPAYFMVNCAHPTHFAGSLVEGSSWLERVKAVRANASKKSHAELDEAEELDRGDVAGLARHYGELRGSSRTCGLPVAVAAPTTHTSWRSPRSSVDPPDHERLLGHVDRGALAAVGERLATASRADGIGLGGFSCQNPIG